ncbi:MAG TPA: YciI family protein [Longimicrobiales bacterium]
MIMIRSDATTESGALPPPEVFEAMGKFNQELIDAGVFVAGEGLQPSSRGARVHFSHGNVRVIDGPFTEAKELIAGFWIWQVKSRDEAIDWLRRSPFVNAPDVTIEVRQVGELEDFGDAVPQDVIEGEKRQRAQAAAQQA